MEVPVGTSGADTNLYTSRSVVPVIALVLSETPGLQSVPQCTSDPVCHTPVCLDEDVRRWTPVPALEATRSQRTGHFARPPSRVLYYVSYVSPSRLPKDPS